MEVFRRLSLIEQQGQVTSSSGAAHQFIIKESGALYACGENEFGQLGTGDTENKSILTRVPFDKAVKMASAGSDHTIVLDTEGAIYACGNDDFGQLGLDSSSPLLTLTQIPFSEPVRSVVAGNLNTYVITAAGKAYACGSNTDGCLGVDFTEKEDAIPSETRCKLALTPVLFDHSIKEIVVGGSHTLFVTDEGALYGCGDNSLDQLGSNRADPIYAVVRLSLEAKIVVVAAGDNHTLVLTAEGQVYACGDNTCGQLGLESGTQGFALIPCEEPVKMICAGYEHSLIVTRSGKLYGCGNNECGQLGLNYFEDRREVMTLIPFTEEIATLTAGYTHTTVVTTDGKTYVCGGMA